MLCNLSFPAGLSLNFKQSFFVLFFLNVIFLIIFFILILMLFYHILRAKDMPKPTVWNLEDKCFSGGQGEKYLIRFLLYPPNNFTPYKL